MRAANEDTMRIKALQPESDRPRDLLAAVARARGCETEVEIEEFLQERPPIHNSIHRLPDFAPALERLRRALAQEESILLFADYDCDGITSLVQLWDFLEAAGHRHLRWFVPDRMMHDYGLTEAAVRDCLAGQRPDLLITLDCGSASHAVVASLRGLGTDCIVLDHHAVEPGGQAHPAWHLNPKAWDRGEAGITAMTRLSAAGLSYLFCERASQDLGVRGWSTARALLLAGLGTVADVMPLLGINRALVKSALQRANDGQTLRELPGLGALHDLVGAGPVDARTFGFLWGPRLNAGGRLEDADHPVRLLRARDLETARSLAQHCQETNQRRRDLQKSAEEQAYTMAADLLGRDPGRKVLLLCDQQWHPGIVGIVASRVRERFCRPAIVCGWHADGYWKGSGRSPESFDLGAAVMAARLEGLLLAGGGHRVAAGVKVSPDHLEEFRGFLERNCLATLEDFRPTHEVLTAADVLEQGDQRDLARAWRELLRPLEPFGAGHPMPNLILRRAQLRWGPRPRTRKDGTGRWAVSGGFGWRGRGYLFADWTELERADDLWRTEGLYDLVLCPTETCGTDSRTGSPATWYGWKVVDCAPAQGRPGGQSQPRTQPSRRSGAPAPGYSPPLSSRLEPAASPPQPEADQEEPPPPPSPWPDPPPPSLSSPPGPVSRPAAPRSGLGTARPSSPPGPGASPTQTSLPF